MATSLFDCPPLDQLDYEEASAVLLGISDSPEADEDLQATIDAKVDADTLGTFLNSLEDHSLMSISTNGVCSSTTFFTWRWHPGHGCGVIYFCDPDQPHETNNVVDLKGRSSRDLADGLMELFQSTDFGPINFSDGLEIELPMDGIEPDDLADVMGQAVFSLDPDLGDPAVFAQQWVCKHSRFSRGTGSSDEVARS